MNVSWAAGSVVHAQRNAFRCINKKRSHPPAVHQRSGSIPFESPPSDSPFHILAAEPVEAVGPEAVGCEAVGPESVASAEGLLVGLGGRVGLAGAAEEAAGAHVGGGGEVAAGRLAAGRALREGRQRLRLLCSLP